MRILFILLAPVLLAACAAPGPSDLTGRRAPAEIALPPAKTFAPRAFAPPQASNAELARDFLELSFQMESGRRLPVFSRFEGPITLRLTGDVRSGFAGRDLDALLARLRDEARIDIRRVDPGVEANITVEAVSRRALQRVVPQAACFVVPNARSWDEFRRLRRTGELDWARVGTRRHVAIFLPGDVAPQEVRDCLHEELAQALGPLNDLYRLPSSVFNDDNFHTVLTGFDMLMLRATYSPHLSSGMTRGEVAARLPAIFATINPGGGRSGIAAPIHTPREWTEAIETALGPGASDARRRQAAERALVIAHEGNWDDTRTAFSHFVVARLSLARQADVALASFFRAASYYGASQETELQSAHVGMQLAAYALSAGDGEAAVGLIDSHLPVVARAQNAALLSTLLLIKAEALDLQGRTADAVVVRDDGLGWARYGFGSDAEVQSRLAEIASLRPPLT